MGIRYSFGGDEHIFVEISEDMSLQSFFKSLTYTDNIKKSNITGITEVCPANASFQIKFNPDIIHPDILLEKIKEIIAGTKTTNTKLSTRIIEIPVYYQDPWTYETLMKFRDRHQNPSGTDIEYAAELNGYQNVDSFIAAHSGSPWIVTMVGFVSGLPFLYQMTENEKQIQVPKYIRPRTDTPKLTVGYGGCFSCLYSVRGAGGYQMFGITPMPIYDPSQTIKYLREFMVFFKPGDIVKWKPIDRNEYDKIVKRVEANEFMPLIRQTDFSLDKYNQSIEATNQQLLGALYDN